MRNAFHWAALFLLTVAPLANAAHVEATMLSHVAAIKPGEPFEVGIDLKMSPGWHTYWVNPGDAGLATRVKWTLPSGFTADELQFPVPTRFDEPGGIVVYGYENEVMLIARITPPADLKIDQPVTVAGKVSWLCCAEVCIPGSAALNVSLKVADRAESDNEPLFTRWHSSLPTPSTAAVTPLLLNAEHPKAEIFLPRILSKDTTLIPGAVDGLVIEVGSPTSETRGGVAGTVVPIIGRVLKGQLINADRLTVLITHRESLDALPVGEAVIVPIKQ